MHPLSSFLCILFPMHPLSSDMVCGAFISAHLIIYDANRLKNIYLDLYFLAD